jgi:hypothetical protein
VPFAHDIYLSFLDSQMTSYWQQVPDRIVSLYCGTSFTQWNKYGTPTKGLIYHGATEAWTVLIYRVELWCLNCYFFEIVNSEILRGKSCNTNNNIHSPSRNRRQNVLFI